MVLGYLGRHGVGDWGEVDEWDRKANDLALVNGKRLVSGYTTETGVRLSITTEWDRTLTIASLPGEY